MKFFIRVKILTSWSYSSFLSSSTISFIILYYSDVGGASSAQGAKADSAIQGVRGNGTAILPDESRIVNITPENIEAVPITRTIIEKALSSNITINALDIGAATIEQGNKADSAIQSIQGNGKIIQPDFNRSVVITPENIGAVPLERCVAARAESRESLIEI